MPLSRAAGACPSPEIYHGGDLAAARLRFPDAPSPWLDLSTGVNAWPYPIGTIEETAWTRLPDATALAALQAAAAGAYGVADPSLVAAAPGTQALIQLLPRILPAKRVAIHGFGYQEHPAVWRAAGADVRIVERLDALADPGVDVAVVVNPNNPDGRITDPRLLRDLAAILDRRGGALIVDEAFMDAVRPSASLAPMLPKTGAIVLRSFGKVYGLAGLRLGFALTGAEFAAKIRAAFGPWAVSGPAIAIGAKALADHAWLDDAAVRLAKSAARLDLLLIGAGFSIVGGSPLFRLARHADAAGWFERLGRAGILVRPFSERPHWLRFGLPGEEAEWARLQEILKP